MIDDPGVHAIMCARGGYGFVRIVGRLDFSRLVSKPKWIIGFSDITVLHGHLNRNYGIASIHSKMCNSFPEDWSKADPIQMDTILSIRRALTGESMSYTTMPSAFNKAGTATGVLVGGNLKTIETLAGSKSDLHTAGKILFVEDTGEYLYSIDRMFWNLLRTGKLEDLKGLVVGGFKVKPDDPGEEFGRTVQDIVLEKVKDFNYPVCFDFPVGHQKNNYALKCGVIHKLTVSPETVSLTEV
jgi:muramoyltetrapeptide carboxypeptidase